MKADSIIYGRIVTLDTDAPLVEAMVVKDGKIAYLGSKAVARIMQGEKTEILDFGEDTVYPGFMDAHTHGPLAAERLALQAQLVGGQCMQDYVDTMAAYVADNPEKAVYLGSGWDIFSEPTAAMLDAICKDKPMVLRSVDGHSIWMNTAAMKDCGIDRAYAKKMGAAEVHVDASGDPTGLVCEKAVADVIRHYPISLEDMKKALLKWQEFAFSQGITAVAEAFLDTYPVCMEAYSQLQKEGKWKLRTYAYLANSKMSVSEPEKTGAYLKAAADKYNGEYFSILGQKIILDGVIEAHTAALIEEYADQPGYYGVLNIQDQALLNKIVLSVNAAGFPVHTHSIGDKTSMMILDAYQNAETQLCNFDIRNAFCHLQLIRPEDIRRCADFDVIAVVAPTWAPVEYPCFDDSVRYLGEKRAWEQYPIKSFEKAGATICFHTDYPVNSVMNVPLSVYTAVKRAMPKDCESGGPKSVMNPDEAIDPLRALLAMTINVAYMCRQENHLGTFALGKIANATVYSKDFITLEDPEDIMKAELVATIVDGKVVYSGAKN